MRIWVILGVGLLLAPMRAQAEESDDTASEEEDPEGWARVYLDESDGLGAGAAFDRSRELGAGAAVLNWTAPGTLFGLGSMAVGVSGDKRAGAVLNVLYLSSSLGANLLARRAYDVIGGDPLRGLPGPIVFGSLQAIGGMLWIEGAGNYTQSFSFFGGGTQVDQTPNLVMMMIGGLTGISGFVGMITDTQLFVSYATRERIRIERDGGEPDEEFEPSLVRHGVRLTGLGVAPTVGGAQLGFSLSW